LLKGFDLGDDDAGAAVMLITGRGMLESDVEVFDEAEGSGAFWDCSSLGGAAFVSADDAEVGGPPSLANRLARIWSIACNVSSRVTVSHTNRRDRAS
jgi:hypothetical protein